MIEIIFTTQQAQERFQSWLEKYARWAADPNTDSAPVRVVIPSRNFDKLGVLEGRMTYGDQFGTVVYKTSLEFMGGRDPVDIDREGINLVSLAVEGENSEHDLVRLYPAGSAIGSLNSWNQVGTYVDKDFDPRKSGPQ